MADEEFTRFADQVVREARRQRGFEKVDKPKEYGSNWKYEPIKIKDPLLTEIDPTKNRANLGKLLYDFPITGLPKSVRNFERALFDLRDKVMGQKMAAEGRGGETTGTEISAEKKSVFSKLLFNLALAHREGHIKGIGNILRGEHGRDLVNGVLVLQSETEEDKKLLVGKVGALVEASKIDQDTEAMVMGTIRNSEIWKKVIAGGVTNSMEIPGISEANQDLFPGAINYELPQRISISPRFDQAQESVLKEWSRIIEDSTAERAENFVKEQHISSVASKIYSTLESSVQ